MTGTAEEWRLRAREHFDVLLDGISSSWAEDREEVRHATEKLARDQFAESVNQGLRRLRQTTDAPQVAALTVELAAQFAPRCAMFLFRDGQAQADFSRGLGDTPLSFSPNEGAAFQSAIETKDPVAAMGTASEISSALAARMNGEELERVFLFPMVIRNHVQAILFAAGDVQAAALELIAGLGAAQMEVLSPPAVPVPEKLVSIVNVAQDGEAKANAFGQAASKWTDLPAEIQALHLKAQRVARLRAAEIRLQHGEAFVLGLERANLYGSLRGPIDAAREEFRRDYFSTTPTMVDYLYLELLRALAHDDNRLLGPEFPGPLVH